jgi:hypothetical protein
VQVLYKTNYLLRAHDNIVCKQGTKALLHEMGHVVDLFECDKTWTADEVMSNLRNAFHDKLPDCIEFV